MLSGLDFKKELFEIANRKNQQNKNDYNHTEFQFDNHKIQQYELPQVGVGGHLWESVN